AQLEILLRHDKPEELSILFAGGIHDARSGAMVEALSAELATRGAKVGALMGTAYLFTEESVACGAIKQPFQDAAVACGSTSLLETAPGHATRCVANDYVRAFEDEKARLETDGVPAKEMWERLEALNLGRLRLASKGIRREGSELVAVDDELQRSEGMVMIGDVATLRSKIATVSDLHVDVSTGASAILDSVEIPEPAQAKSPPPADVAIIGMSAVLPGAADLATYWSNILSGVNSIREVDPERWNPEIFFDPESSDGKHTPSRWGGFIDPVEIDPMDYGIPPLSLAAIDAAQLLALDVARRALADAGYDGGEFDRSRTSVILGAESGSELLHGYGFRALWRQYVGEVPPELDDVLPFLTEDSFPGVLANVTAGRIANRLDLGGVNYTVDAACASSLAAVDLALKELASGTSDLVLCGGVDLHNAIVDYLVFAAVQALSRTGQCKPFDGRADGITLGEGVAIVALKRAADAVRDGDRIYAIIEGVGGSSDGKSLGLTAPRSEGQVRALDRAYAQAGVSPAQVGLVEAHGTGTVVGDRTELETLSRVFSDSGAEVAACALGSVKSQIGHTKCAAGMAGLIKVALALHHGVLPPTFNIDEPNPAWQAGQSPFTLNDQPQPWVTGSRRAAVSAFGFGGTNFHVVLGGHRSDEEPAGLDQWPAELFLFRGDEAAVEREIDQLAGAIDRDPRLRLRDLARSVSDRAGPTGTAIVAHDIDDLRAKLTHARTGNGELADVYVAGPATDSPEIAFLFPGQGSQRVGMHRDLYVAFPWLRRFLALDEGLAAAILPARAWGDDARATQVDALKDTRVAQPALGIAGLTVASLLLRLGVAPKYLAGHSYGELVALCAAGALDEEALLRLSARRGECIVDAAQQTGSDLGSMAAVSASADVVRPHLDGLDRLVLANENAPDQVVISGPTSSVDEAVERLGAAGLTARAIPVACAFHSPLVADACSTFRAELEAAGLQAPSRSVYSNETAAPYPGTAEGVVERLSAQIGQPVRFVDEIRAMHADGARIFIEAGPGRVLTGLTERILASQDHLALACDREGEHGLVQLQRTVARLATSGVEIDTSVLYEGRDAERLDLDSIARREASPSLWLVNGHRAWPANGELPPHALRPISGPVVNASLAGAPMGSGTDSEQVVLEYLRSTRELVAHQRQVVLGYLGVDGVEQAGAASSSVPNRALEAAPPADAQVSAEPSAVPDDATTESAELDDAETLLREIVSERTGYPTEMLDLDLDLEADLSIDSIKRVEILG
ncbi:MAG: beta-ketoacyl synthase N-terminal-like domain-containing protein, partial [Gaiellaceae bacterium]